jgi:hypothetical protein
MKTCSSCSKGKSNNDFRRNKNAPDGYQYYCKLCASEKIRSAYKAKYAYKVRTRSNKRLAENRQRIQNYKLQHPCNCGEIHVACLEFHHTGGKDFTIAERMTNAWETIEREIQKCIVVCRNCHAKIHWEDQLDRRARADSKSD